MKISLKGFDCTDHDPIDEWIPTESSFHYALCLHIGPKDEQGSELFYVNIVSDYTALGHVMVKERNRSLVIAPYSWGAVLATIEGKLAAIECANWEHATEVLRKMFFWEFDNYKY